jgi:RNA polymerase sigma-70 factor (ECF subfamily)
MAGISPELSEFIALISKHQTAIYAFVRSMVLTPMDAEDIVQETNIALWSNMRRFRPGTNFYAYATRIAYHKVVDHARRQKRHQRVIIDSELAERLAHAVGAAAGDKPERRFVALEECLDKLPPEERSLTEQRYQHGITVRQIARQSECSESALQNQFSRIRHKLRQCVEATLARYATS